MTEMEMDTLQGSATRAHGDVVEDTTAAPDSSPTDQSGPTDGARAPNNTLRKGGSLGQRILKAISPVMSPKSPTPVGLISPLNLASAQRESLCSVKPYTDRWFTFLQKHYTDATSGLMTAQLDRMVRDAVDSLSGSDSSRKHFSRPFLMLLQSPKFMVVMLMTSVVYTFLLSWLCAVLLSSHITGDTFHFELVSPRRAGTIDAFRWNVTDLGVLQDSCEMPGQLSGNKTAFTLSFPREVSVNGWFLSIESLAGAEDEAVEVRMTTQRSEQEHDVHQPAWWTCGRSSPLWTASASASGGLQRFYMSPPAEWIAGCAVEFAVVALGSLASGVLALRGHKRRAWNTLSGTLGALLAVSGLFAVLLTARGEWVLGLRWWRRSVLTALVLPCVALSAAEMLLIPVLCVAGALYEVLLLGDYVARGCGEQVWTTHDLYLGVLLMGLGARLEWRRRRAMAEVRRQLRADTATMEDAWQRVSREITTEDQIQFLNAVAKASLHLAAARPHHTQVVQVSAMRLTVLAAVPGAEDAVVDFAAEDAVREGKGSAERKSSTLWEASPSLPADGSERHAMVHPLRPQLEQQLLEQELHGSLLAGGKAPRIQSLDQLYAQAAGMRLVLQDKVKALALASQGMLPSSAGRSAADPERTFLRVESGSDGGGAEESEVRWAPLKPTIRAVEKAVYEYKGDVSMVVDICRETLVFRHLSELTSCLQAIVADPDITLVRLKNSIGPGHDTEITAGYRSVHVNLLISSAEACALALQGHVCELLLVLAPFALAQTGESHGRFLQLRAMRESSPLDELLLRLQRWWRGTKPAGREMEWEMGGPATGRGESVVSDRNGGNPTRIPSGGGSTRAMIRSLGNSFKGSLKGSFKARETPAEGAERREEEEAAACGEEKRGSECSRSGLLTASGGDGTQGSFSPGRSIPASPVSTVRTRIPGLGGRWKRVKSSGSGMSREVSGLDSLDGMDGSMGRSSWESMTSGVLAAKEKSRRGSWHGPAGKVESAKSSRRPSQGAGSARGSRRSSIVEQVLSEGVARLEGWMGKGASGREGLVAREGDEAEAALLGAKRGSEASEGDRLSAVTEQLSVPASPVDVGEPRTALEEAPSSGEPLPPRHQQVPGSTSPSGSFRLRSAAVQQPGSGGSAVVSAGSRQAGVDLADLASSTGLPRAGAEPASLQVIPLRDHTEEPPRGGGRKASGTLGGLWERLGGRTAGRSGSLFLGRGRPPSGTEGQMSPVSTGQVDGLWMGAGVVDAATANAWRGLLRTQFLISATQPADRLDRQRRDTAMAYANAGSIAVLNSPFPVAAALCKRWFCTLAAVAGGLCLVLFFLHLASNIALGHVAARQCIRFRVPELRGGGGGGEREGPPAGVRWESVVGGFGLLQGGCAVALGGGEWNEAEGALKFVWGGAEGGGFDFHGFWFETNADAPELDPVVFVLEAQRECVGEWEVVGASGRYISVENQVYWLEGKYRTPLERSAPVTVDLRLPWFSWLGRLQQKGVYGLALLGMAWCGVSKRPELGVQVMVVGLWVVLWPWAAVAWGEMQSELDQPGGMPLQWLHPLSQGLIVAGVSWREAWVPELAVFAGVEATAFSIVENEVLLRGAGSGRMLHGDGRVDVSAYTCLVVGILFVVLRRRAITQAKAMIHADILKYRQIWDTIDPQGVLEVHEAAQSMPTLRSAGKAQQRFNARRFTQQFESDETDDGNASAPPPSLSRQPSVSMRSDRSMLKTTSTRTVSTIRSLPDSLTFRSTSSRRMLDLASSILSNKVVDESLQRTLPVGSLDQLYVQAAGMHPVLLDKVQEWALHARGRFRTEGAREPFMLWSEVRGSEELRRMVRYPGLKHHRRATEKIARSYGGKVWLLCDVCRQSIYFSSLLELADCLRAIASDPQVVVAAVKNRLTAEYDDMKTAGYRDVNINLRIVTDETIRFNISSHICEVQLILTSFAELKTDAGHKRYVAYRNARAE